jgi:hypothetical protein
LRLARARDIAVTPDNIECQIVPLRNWDAIHFTFTDEEVEKLAEMEHDRWWHEKLAERGPCRGRSHRW